MSETTLHQRSVTVNGVSVPILEGGLESSDEAVVFVHGNPGSGRDWELLAPEVSKFARAIAPDMPGFGRADKPVDFSYTVQGYADYLAGLIQELGIRRVHLVLHDLGGPWGLAWAATHPDAFASVVLIDTGVLLGYRWHYLARIWRMPIIGELFQMTATRPAFHLLLKHGNPRGLPREFVDRMYDDYDTGTRRAILKLYRSTDRPDEGAKLLAAALHPSHRPALVVWGEHDPYIPAEFALRQREVFPDAEIVMLPESGHWPFADDPSGVSAAVIPFLQRLIADR